MDSSVLLIENQHVHVSEFLGFPTRRDAWSNHVENSSTGGGESVGKFWGHATPQEILRTNFFELFLILIHSVVIILSKILTKWNYISSNIYYF